MLAERMAEEAVTEAEEIGMLLGEDEEEGEDESDKSEEDQYFLKPPAQGPPRPRMRPAPALAEEEPAVATALEAAHLFPRNLKTDYPVAVRAEEQFVAGFLPFPEVPVVPPRDNRRHVQVLRPHEERHLLDRPVDM